MVVNAFPPDAPEPAVAPVGVAPVQPPFATDSPPATMIIAVQSLIAVLVVTNASVAIRPPPLSATVETVAIVVPPQQSPPPATVDPAIAIPRVEHALAVQMAANAFPAPTPTNHIASAGAAWGSPPAAASPKQLAAVGGKFFLWRSGCIWLSGCNQHCFLRTGPILLLLASLRLLLGSCFDQRPVVLHDFAIGELLAEAVIAIGFGLVLIGPLPVWPSSSQIRLKENFASRRGVDLDRVVGFGEFRARNLTCKGIHFLGLDILFGCRSGQSHASDGKKDCAAHGN